MLLSSNGIVIQSFKYGENSLISKVISEEKGLLTLISNRSKSKKNKQGNFFQPLSAISFVCYLSNKSTIHRVKELSFNRSVRQPNENVSVNAIRFFLAELLSKIIKEEEQNISLYSFLELKINQLNHPETELSIFHIQFLIDFFEQLGIQPDLDPEEFYFDLQDGCTTNNKPQHDDYYERRQLEPYIKIQSQNPLSKTERLNLLNLLLNYCNIQLGGSVGTIKSKAVLEVIFS